MTPGSVPPPPIDRRWAAGVVVACVAASTAALLVPATLAYDPWAWLVWGREVAALDLDTTGGPSWKPLPILATIPVAAAGGWAPEVWLVLARTLGLLAFVGAYRVARTLGGRAAGCLAAALLVLTPDGGPRVVRLVLEGHTAPIAAGLALWAIDRHLAGRPRATLGLLLLLALDRPEGWPFLALYGLWLWRERPGDRRLVVAALLAVPVLWFGADWWGSGSPLHGADAAQVDAGDGGRFGRGLQRADNAVILPVWIAALGAVALWRRRRPPSGRVVPLLLAAALAWSALVVGMGTLLGYASLARFFLPAAGLVVVVAAVGVTWAVEQAGPGWLRRVVVVVVALASAPSIVGRASHLGALLDEVEGRAVAEDDLAAVIDAAGGRRALVACGPLTIDTGDVPQPALAWHVHLALSAVDRRAATSTPAGTMVVRAGGRADAALAAAPAPVAEVARNDGWAVYTTTCRSPD